MAATLAAALAILLLSRRARRFSASREARARAARSLQGEHDARALLEDLGYHVIDEQVSKTWVIDVDGEPIEVELRADLLVDKGGERMVAEVKTGDVAPSVTTTATRRQLLEYQLAYQVTTVLLVDVERAEVSEVRFPTGAGQSSKKTIHQTPKTQEAT